MWEILDQWLVSIILFLSAYCLIRYINKKSYNKDCNNPCDKNIFASKANNNLIYIRKKN